MRRSILLLPACLAFAAIAGCGNKGPLYMPPATPKPAPAKHATPAPAAAPAHSSTSQAPASSSTSAAPASSSSVVTKPLGGS